MDDILQRIGETQGPTALAIIAGMSALEYLFPPFPGDFAVAAGAFLVAARGWSLLPVLAASTGGSLAGALGHILLGRALAARKWAPKGPRGQRVLAATLAVVARFERHGAAYIAVNRFLPGVRSVFFLAAGWSGMPIAKALGWGAVSALAWNLLLVGVAFAVGREWETLASLVQSYALVAWGVLAVLAVVAWLRWRKRT